MSLYGAAKAPAVPDKDGKKEGNASIAHIAIATTGGNTYADSAVNAAVNTAIDAINAKLNSLIGHLNDGRK